MINDKVLAYCKNTRFFMGFLVVITRAERWVRCMLFFCVAASYPAAAASSATGEGGTESAIFNDAHFHLTNYIQQGISADRYFEIVGDRVGRVAMFGIPLQQKWDYFVTGDRNPDYYLRSDAALYYYSYVDAAIAMEYQSLSDSLKRRVDPMITGFNPTDMYAADHIRRVLLTFPGVFTGIGEFSVHKEFVSAKVAGHTASLSNPALDRIFEAVAEIGLVAIMHCDIDTVRQGEHPVHYDNILRLLAAHPDASVIWAHTGLGRFIAPAAQHLALLDQMLDDPRYDHVMLDISWDLVARYVVRDADATKAWARLIEKHSTRFLFGTDSVAPVNWDAYAATHTMYNPLWQRLSANTRAMVERLNYERIFDTAKARVRVWESRQ
ncbi:MAG: amidohydrolase [Gammaproteobacteria bacterium]|nr:amidohydrolase [Gammaproteobacteria bacterium]MCY4356914.1 amidohydrolase [Gammaproteobacteria bacterium]